MAFNRRRYDRLVAKGFLPSEARQYSIISKQGQQAPYYRSMLRSRTRLVQNAKRYDWSDYKLRQRIRQQYVDNNAFKPDASGRMVMDVWKMYRIFADRYQDQNPEFLSERMRKINKAKKKGKGRVTMTDMIRSQIKNVNQTIDKEKDPVRKATLIEKRNYLWRRLESSTTKQPEEKGSLE